MSIFIPPNIKVVVEGDSGEIRYSQKLSEYFNNPSINLQMATYGRTLLDVLIEEAYISEDLVLKQVLTGDAHADATRLIGSIAESLVVNLCNSDPEVNRALGMYARFGQRSHKKLDDYVAVATGSMRAKNYFPQHYNPCDTQRDIIWVEKDNTDNQLLCISSNNSVGAKPAGLQVKASHDGVRYVVPNIQDYHYPVLYFDLNNDWGAVQKKVLEQHETATLVNPDEIQHEIKHILRGYFDIVVALIRGEITLKRIIQESKWEGDSVLPTGIDSAEPTNDSKLILPSYLRDGN
ncbi:hypothetical protein [Shewanella algae]|uniref:hypothetical protein n=1 Tax=Shewanella algae TaxID=38313 RepID=UPI001FB6C34A|nr:hypothetical protein [Shewanella algae]